MALQVYHDDPDDGHQDNQNNSSPYQCWMQTFIPDNTFTPGVVKIKATRTGGVAITAGTLMWFGIYAVDGSGHPTGTPIASRTTPLAATIYGSDWVGVVTQNTGVLTAATKYALKVCFDGAVPWEWHCSNKNAYNEGYPELTNWGSNAQCSSGWQLIDVSIKTWAKYIDNDLLFEIWDAAYITYREYLLRGVTDNKGRPIALAECKAYNSTDQANLVYIETRYTDENGVCTFRFLPADAPVDICVTWGGNVRWYRNVFNTDGSALETAVAKAHDQNTDTNLGTLSTKNPPVNADLVIQRNSASSFALFTSTWTQVKAFLKTYFDTVYGSIGSSHTQNTDTGLGTLGTKNPPIDADKVIYRDSASSDALVTSTWTQVKAFLKTYWDTIYAALVHASRHQSGGADAIKLDDLSAPDDNTDLDGSAAKHGLYPKADASKLAGIEAGAQVNDPETDPVFLASEASDFVAGDKAKLDGIEALADVTDADNVYSAGALMRVMGTPSDLTISSGVITAGIASYYNILPEAGSNLDDLVTINGGSEGKILFLRASSINEITLKHNTGNIFCLGDEDITIYATTIVMLVYGGASKWIAYRHGSTPTIPKSLFLGATDGWPSTTNGCNAVGKTEFATNKININTLAFDAATDEYAEWTRVLPSNYVSGLTAKFIWTSTAIEQIIGTSTAGGSNSPNGYATANQFVCSKSGELLGLKVYCRVNSNVRVSLYSDDGSNGVGNLLAESGSVAVTSGAWSALIALSSSVAVTSGTKYWLAFQCETSGGVAYRVSAGQKREFKAQAYGAFPADGTGWTDGVNFEDSLQGWGSPSGDVIWNIQARAYINDDAIDQAWGAVSTATDTLIAFNDVHVSPVTGTITSAGTVIAGNLIQFRVSRDADNVNDTLGADAQLIGVIIDYL